MASDDRPRPHPAQGDGEGEGEGEGFAVFQQRWRGRVYAWVKSIIGDRERAEEITLDVFCRAWRALPRFRGDCVPGAWLHRITTNCCRTALRRSGQPVVLFSELDGKGDDGEKFDCEGGVDPAAQCERRLACEAVRAVLDSLPAEWRELVALVDLQGLSYKEAADTLGLTRPQVRTRLSYGRARFRELYLSSTEAER